MTVFLDAVRSDETLAGVFEDDGETGYFYLYDVMAAEGKKIVDAIYVYDAHGAEPDGLSIVWDPSEEKVALKIGGAIWAVFDSAARSRYGGDYRPGGTPRVPDAVLEAFRHR